MRGRRGDKANEVLTDMSELVIWTYDWVPEGPRGFVRDLRLRWACEEAGLAYSVRTVPFEDRATNHLARQPFGQVPFLDDGDVRIFESGAGLLHLARKSEKLMPRDPVGEAETIQWMIAALNSIEMVSVPWWFLEISGATDNALAGWMGTRLDQLERILGEREWLVADRFTAADLLMADVLRVSKLRAFGDRPASEAYVTRVTDRPAFAKARADQMAHFGRADDARKAAPTPH
ncbi:MAG: glutathione S-transferase family protein [Enhydrobacter sp.]|nr:glutathione S-transferase family protein [Enhydrobacter sp.]